MTETAGVPRVRGPMTPLIGGAAISAVVALLVGLANSCVPDRAGTAAKPAPGASARATARAPVAPLPNPAGAPSPIEAPGYSPLAPVLAGSFADPAAIKVAGTYFAYGTNSADAAMPVATAPTPSGPWTRQPGDGLARLPGWAVSGRTWAPEVVPPRNGSGSYLLYFSARRKDRDVQCIGTATASSPAGPFVPVEGQPLVCPLDLGGAIDPASYIEPDGTRYLLYKSDAQKSAAIYLVRLTPDGLGVAAAPQRLLGRSDEPVLVEAPKLVRRGGKYVLLYSAGWYFSSDYQTRYATADSIAGPYTKAGAPLQSTGVYGGKVQGPGSADVLSDDTGDYLLFHAITKYNGGSSVNRGMYVTPLGWDGARPAIRGVPVRYEAEKGRLNGCVSELKRPRASGDKAIGPFDRDGCRAEVQVFAPSTGRYSARIQYTNRSGAESHLELSANGSAAATLRLAKTGDTAWTSTTVQISLSGGWNTLGLRRLDGQGQIDYIELR
ncbi:family 43 glycosylhydrolase [Actinomadura fibrosa]|uniref:Family 43 glycosylhydrolase n=1 Tax=Actinomadura fibrosa TaxID=111802 RepID=A0ABW2Y1F0_9ACTN|nr:family 43 glycosylhydrolase [Actinomadura fibrosa]